MIHIHKTLLVWKEQQATCVISDFSQQCKMYATVGSKVHWPNVETRKDWRFFWNNCNWYRAPDAVNMALEILKFAKLDLGPWGGVTLKD